MTRTTSSTNPASTRLLALRLPIVAGFWALACGPALSEPVRVYVGGQPVEAGAQVSGGVVSGQLLPVLAAAGAQASLVGGGEALSVTAPDGTELRAAIGSRQLQVNGKAVSCTAAFETRDGEVMGPIGDVARAIGCAVDFDEEAMQLRIAHRLTQVEAHAAEEAALVYLRLSGSAAGELRHLRDPPRAYTDFAGLVWGDGSEALEVGGAGGLRKVRWALSQVWPPITRVVLDLEPGASAQLSQVADRLFVITVRPGASGSSDGLSGRLANAHVVLDPAAGGADHGGAGAQLTGKATNLDIAILLAVRLMDAGVMVTLTRDSDVTVVAGDRARIANGVKPDLILTIGCGAADSPDECGVEVRYAGGSARELAARLQAALVGTTGARNRTVSLSPEGCLPGTEAPCASAIVGYLTCQGDERLLASPGYRDRVAAGLEQGIATYLRDRAETQHAAAKEARNQ